MQKPILNPIPFANDGQKNTIPDVASGGSASFSQGFPTLTMTPISQGGIPPSGQDFNGILNHLDEHIVWQSAGMGYQYDVDFANKIGGYAKGAIIRSHDGLTAYVSTIDGNKTDPENGGQNWNVFAGAAIKIEPIKVGGILFHANYTTPEEVHAGEGYGTWERFAEGRVIIGTGTGTDKNSITKTFQLGDKDGEYDHVLTVDEMPHHHHSPNEIFNKFTANYDDLKISSLQDDDPNTSDSFSDGSGSSQEAVIQYQNWDLAKEQAIGGSQPHNNIQPFVAIGIWKRVA